MTEQSRNPGVPAAASSRHLTSTIGDANVALIRERIGSLDSKLPHSSTASEITPGLFICISYGDIGPVVDCIRAAPIDVQFDALNALATCVNGGEFLNSEVAAATLSELSVRSESAFISALCRFVLGERDNIKEYELNWRLTGLADAAALCPITALPLLLENSPQVIASDRIGLFCYSNLLVGVIEEGGVKTSASNARVIATAREVAWELDRLGSYYGPQTAAGIQSSVKSGMLRIHAQVALTMYPAAEQVDQRLQFWNRLVAPLAIELEKSDVVELDQLAKFRGVAVKEAGEIRAGLLQRLKVRVVAHYATLSQELPEAVSALGLAPGLAAQVLRSLNNCEDPSDFMGALQNLEEIYDRLEQAECDGMDCPKGTRAFGQALFSLVSEYEDTCTELWLYEELPTQLDVPAAVVSTTLDESETLEKLAAFIEIERPLFLPSIKLPGFTKDIRVIGPPPIVDDHGLIPIFIERLKQAVTGWCDSGRDVEKRALTPDSRQFSRITDIINDPKLFPYQDSASLAAARLLPNLYHPRVVRVLSEAIGFPLVELTFKDQIHLLCFAVRTTADEWKQFQAAIGRLDSTAGANFLRCFFGCVEDPQHGRTLIRIAEVVEPSQGEEIFSKLAHLYNLAESIGKLVDEAGPADLKMRLFSKALQLQTSRTNGLCKEIGDSCREGASKFEGVFARLKSIDEELVALGAVIKGERELDVSFGQIDSKFEIAEVPSNRVSEPLKTELILMAQRNMDGYPEEIRRIALSELIASFNSELSRFYMLRFKEGVVSFVRCDSRADQTVYFGSFNTRADATGLAFGAVLLERALQIENAKAPIVAMVHGANPFRTYYCEHLGFEATPVEVAGEKCFKLSMPRGFLASRAKITSVKA